MAYYEKLNLTESEPITVAEFITSLKLDTYVESEVVRIISAARQAAEDYCNVDFVKKEYAIFFDTVPCSFKSRQIPLITIKSVSAYKTDGTIIDIKSNYEKGAGNRIINIQRSKITDLRSYDCVKFVVEVGAGTPEKVKEAILWYCINTYNKEEAKDWMSTFKSLLANVKVYVV